MAKRQRKTYSQLSQREERYIYRCNLKIINEVKTLFKERIINNTIVLEDIKHFNIENNNIKIDDTIINSLIDSGGSSTIFSTKDDNNILKIMCNGTDEIDKMKEISKFVIEKTTPHFVILYKSIKKCNKIVLNEDQKNNYILNNYTETINSYIKNADEHISVLIMEKFDGNIFNFINYNILNNINYLKKDEKSNMTEINNLLTILKNIHAQICIAILSFRTLYGYHGDCQYKNFFYKSISYTKKDYFHYNIFDNDIYIKNIGFLIVIGDYGTCIKKEDSQQKSFKDDYIFLNCFKDYLSDTEYSNFYEKMNEKDFFIELMKKYQDIFIKKIEDKELINETPYLIKIDYGGKKTKKIKKIKKYD
jgi:hypothetical protein